MWAFDSDYFWNRVDKTVGPDACWPWLAGTDKDGYGVLASNDKHQLKAHRAAHFTATGDEPPVVRHSCDNPPCCNPAHLLGGTTADNVKDKINRKRHNFGERNGKAKLTHEIVLICRKRYSPRDPTNGCAALAREFKVSTSTMSLAISGKQWAYQE